MNPWELPACLTVGDAALPIRTDFRVALYLLDIFADPLYEQDEKGAICLQVLFERWEDIPEPRRAEALEKAVEFLDGGLPAGKDGRRPRLVDLRQDGPIILPAVNRVLGREIRDAERLHWWTFLGAYMEIGESLFSTVLGIRQKRAKGKKLEKYEQEFLRENRALVDLRPRQTERDRAQRDELRALFV